MRRRSCKKVNEETPELERRRRTANIEVEYRHIGLTEHINEDGWGCQL